jgi:hypothetical protein
MSYYISGSTDAVAYCTTGINDPITSALHIIIGNVIQCSLNPFTECSDNFLFQKSNKKMS